MLKKIISAIALAVVALIVFVATRPTAFHIERSAEMKAPAAVVFPLVNDLHQWRQWSPWEKIDPEMKREYSGKYAGTGAIYAWEGNDEVGKGRMTITESEPSRRISIDIEFITPFPAKNRVSFDFTPVAQGTKVTWAMDGENNFVGKLFDLLMDFDSMVGADYERGLAKLKALAETKPKTSS